MIFLLLGSQNIQTTDTATKLGYNYCVLSKLVLIEYHSRDMGSSEIISSDNCRRRMQLGRNQKSPTLISKYRIASLSHYRCHCPATPILRISYQGKLSPCLVNTPHTHALSPLSCQGRTQMVLVTIGHNI